MLVPKAQENHLLLEVRNLVKHFPFISRRAGLPQRLKLKAVDGVSFVLQRREVLGLVGESGCGKTTTGRLVAGLLRPDSGDILYKGKSLVGRSSVKLPRLRRRIQMIFQDPVSSLDPRMKVGAILEEPLVVNKIGTVAERRQRVAEILTEVGLHSDAIGRYPHEFSGGQRQRIGIGRALALKPELVVADEPVSALDVSIQAQIINLLLELRENYALSLIFIAHDLSVVRAVCERVAIMYLGLIVETGTTESVFKDSHHPYTQALLSAAPVPDPTVRFAEPPL
ncbi:MAG: peptide ABC transporter ATP-binding protein, partial [Candidatus Riflebacteria bacterium RBG_13_59_9]